MAVNFLSLELLNSIAFLSLSFLLHVFLQVTSLSFASLRFIISKLLSLLVYLLFNITCETLNDSHYKEQINQRLFLYKSLCMFNDEYADCFLICIFHKLFISSGILILFSASIHLITDMFYIYHS